MSFPSSLHFATKIKSLPCNNFFRVSSPKNSLPYFQHEDFRDYHHDLSIPEIKTYMRALILAMEHVHAHGIIHRDVKPSNFLYNRETQQGVLVDFGLAQVRVAHLLF